MSQPLRLHVAAVNLKKGGYDPHTRFHDHSKLDTMLSTLATPPHILFMSECTYYTERMLFDEPLFDALKVLESRWGSTEDEHGHTVPVTSYHPFLSTVDGSVNEPGLFVDRRYVQPCRWYNEKQRAMLANSLVATINGHKIRLKSVHWNGSGGSTLFDQQSSRDGQMAQHPSIFGGDFNNTSSAPAEDVPDDWGAYCDAQGQPYKRSQKGRRNSDGTWSVHTDAIDAVLEHGWRDMGDKAGDFTPTVNSEAGGDSGMRIDRIMVSKRAPVRLVPGTYTVHIPKPGTAVSDHRMVSCWLEFAPPGHDWQDRS
jgi:endonuclease/exonuclease/phosphatase family metal-dependent hydrolase